MSSRVMVCRANGQKVTVHGWFMTVNGWEFYTLDNNVKAPVRPCLVYGYEVEIGDVSREEVAPYVQIATTDLTDLGAAPGWYWEDMN